MRGRLILASAAMLAVGQIASAAVLNSNGTGGGLWSSPSTWDGVSVPGSGGFGILGADTVNMDSGVTYNFSTLNPAIAVGGTLNIQTGASMTVNRLNYLYTGAGVSNFSVSGGSASIGRAAPGTGNTLAISINSGYLKFRDGVSTPVSVPITQSGGVLDCGAPSVGGAVTLSGGVFRFSSPLSNTNYINNLSSWTGGTIANTYGWSSGSFALTPINSKMSAGCVLDVSDQSASAVAQTMNFSGTGLKITAGTVDFDVYGATDNNNDKITTTISYSGANAIGSAVAFNIGDGQGLAGLPGDYVGRSYQIISAAAYTNLNPSIAPAQWVIGGDTYNVTFTNHLNVDGGVTIASVTVVPEPAALSLLGLGGASLCLRSRRRN